MNCINHPDAAVAAYCQNCGKALCTNCVRSVAGVVYCEQCLAVKLGVPPAGTTQIPPMPPILDGGPNPGLATLLGFIPGVGAMYNGQYVKALVHVLVFAVLIALAGDHGIFGLFIAAWVFYQVFDAHQTAKARRDGLPLPDPFGLNELGRHLGIPQQPVPPPPPAYQQTYQQAYQQPPPPPGTAAGFTPVQPPPYGEPYAYPPMPPMPPEAPHRSEPIGAIVLIGLGLLFLFGTLNVFRFDWIGHGWPVIIIVVGVWLLFRRTRGVPPPPSSGGVQ
jgi:TM2 domain-containing membrane protein YozV